MSPLVSAAWIGAITGIRSTAGMAAVSGAPAWRLLSYGEMLADKLPFTPARTSVLPLAGRSVLGGLAAARLGKPGAERVATTAIGAASAFAATFAVTRLRSFAYRRGVLANVAAGLVEDGFIRIVQVQASKRGFAA